MRLQKTLAGARAAGLAPQRHGDDLAPDARMASARIAGEG